MSTVVVLLLLLAVLGCYLLLLGWTHTPCLAAKNPKALKTGIALETVTKAISLHHILEALPRVEHSRGAVRKRASSTPAVGQEKILLDTHAPISTVDRQFLSVTLGAKDIKKDWRAISFMAPRIINMARALSPAMLRVGGTDEDFMIFNATANPPESNFTMTPLEWDQVNQFVKAVGWDFIFGLSARLRSPFPTGVWDTTNAMSLMSYSNSKNYTVQWELGNEPNSWKIPLSAHEHAKDFLVLSDVLKEQTSPGKMIVGPDVTHFTCSHYFTQFLETLPQDTLTAVTYHHYYGNGKNGTLSQFYDVDLLDEFITVARCFQKTTTLLHSRAHVWLGETSNLCGGGTPHLSDSYVAGFMWLDKLGIAAVVGHKRVFRQTFVGSNYALLDSNQNPLPDYWLSVLFKKLVGTKVLYIAGSLEEGRYLRAYAHCAKHPYSAGSVVLLLLNMNFSSVEADLQNTELSSSDRDVYWLSPPAGNLTSTSVQLNGVSLQLVNNEELPDFKPEVQPASSSVILPSISFGFIVFKNAQVIACLKDV